MPVFVPNEDVILLFSCFSSVVLFDVHFEFKFLIICYNFSFSVDYDIQHPTASASLC